MLVIPQPLIVGKNKVERNLLSFTQQYRQLVAALGHTGHDIVVLTGDVHFGRISTCKLGPKGGRLIEIISSPLSNLTGLSGISTATPSFKPKKFPHASTMPPGWAPQPVRYDRDFSVDTLKSQLFSGYPRARTKEHFMTVGFSRASGGKVKLSAQSWHVRERRGPKQLPTKGFPRAFTARLA